MKAYKRIYSHKYDTNHEDYGGKIKGAGKIMEV